MRTGMICFLSPFPDRGARPELHAGLHDRFFEL